MLCILSAEIWYLSEILLQAAVRGYQEAKTYRGIVYTTYQESALARGLTPDRGEAAHAFKEALQCNTPRELRGFFIMLTVNGYATIDIFKNTEYYKALQDDFLHESNESQVIADKSLIQDLSFCFKGPNAFQIWISRTYQKHSSELDIEKSSIQ